ncbi:MAG: NAD(P)-dependent oxidoreductase [Lachnospiraceae bacterium]|nr:NAD(P)-dependent oxidoreductase [Lachnospiraceae bacterium]
MRNKNGGVPRTCIEQYVRWDIGHEEMPEEFKYIEVNAVVHAAACITTNDEDMELSYVNLVGTHRIANLCREKRCDIVVLISSTPIIGIPDGNPITERTPLNPLTMYHATKAAQELILGQLTTVGIRVANLRVASPIAPIMAKDTIFTMFAKNAHYGRNLLLNGKGTRRQNYIDTRDIAQAVDKIIDANKASGIYYCASDVTTSNAELAEMCIKIADSKSKMVYSGIPDDADNQVWEIDSSRIRNEIGFEQEYTIAQTIRDFIQNLERTS